MHMIDRPLRRRHRRGLRFELLEARQLLAGDTYLVNFQNNEATTPTGYMRDTGELFGDRGDGFNYGWSSDHTDQARERSIELDQRLDTLIHIEAGQDWEFELPNGLYEVTVAIGDPSNDDGVHTINVEDVNYWNGEPDVADALIQTQQVTVSDDRLTIDAGAAADKATRIDFVHIVGLANGPNNVPDPPTITEPAVDAEDVNPANVQMAAGGFSDSDGDLHKSTDWEIRTVGPGAQPVWQTLGIEGSQRLDAELDDGIFLNSLAGQSELSQNTDYELRVRFRDDAGSVSEYATRPFHTAGESSSVLPLEVTDVATIPAPTWEDVFASPVDLPDGSAILSPGDPILAVDTDGTSSYPGNEDPPNAIDGTIDKYLNFGEVNSGFIVTPSNSSAIITSFQVTTANDAEERDPTSWALYGTNDPVTSADNSDGSQENWTLIDSGGVSLPSARNAPGPTVPVDSDTAWTSYRMIFTGVKNESAANSMQIAEIEFFGETGGSGTPASLSLQSAAGEPLLTFTASEQEGNTVENFPPLAGGAPIRIVVESGSVNLFVRESNLSFENESGESITVYLPAIELAAEERLDLWIADDGSTYFGTAGQTEPNFTFLARAAALDVPYIITQPGFVIEEVGNNYRLPVNIAFVPNPGPNPNDPLYYVTELYGSIQVVTRDGTKHEFATGLLDYNPQGPISGTGEQGLTGLTVIRDDENPEIYDLFVGMLADNNNPPGGAVHYPKVERIESVAGGLSMDSRTVLLNMEPETQGQSHQISNVSIGPDGKLYVHNGDGFNTPTAQNLDQFRGKILRLNLDGTIPTDNPFYDESDGINSRDYVYAYGFRNPFGGAWRASDGMHYEVENGPSVDRFAQIVEGKNYEWDGSNNSILTNAIYNWIPAHAPVNITFVQRETFNGSQFPAEKMDRAFVSESGPTYANGPQSNGKMLTEFTLDAAGSLLDGPDTLVEYVGEGRSSIVGLAAGPDGLYFTTLYEDSGASGPTAIGARIYRVRYVNPIAGDYDIDGDVDEDDGQVWRQTYGSNLLLAADGNHNGRVDAGDYVVWRNALANAAAAASATATAAAGETSSDAVQASAESQPQNVARIPVENRSSDRDQAVFQLAQVVSIGPQDIATDSQHGVTLRGQSLSATTEAETFESRNAQNLLLLVGDVDSIHDIESDRMGAGDGDRAEGNTVTSPTEVAYQIALEQWAGLLSS